MVYGVGVGYKRFFGKRLHSTLYATNFLTQYFDSDYKIIQYGYQLMLRAVVGYRFRIFGDRWYLAPSVEFFYLPVNTNLPESFEEIEKDYTNYNLGQINMYFGYRF